MLGFWMLHGATVGKRVKRHSKENKGAQPSKKLKVAPQVQHGIESIPGEEEKVDHQLQQVPNVRQDKEENKRDMPSMTSPSGEQEACAIKVDPQVQQIVKDKQEETSVGRGCNINNRHANHLESLLALMSAKRHPLEITDDRDRVLKRHGCSSGLYMEWSKKEDQYFLWGSTAAGKLMIKFEFHGGLDDCANLLSVKNPILSFSQSFDCNNGWREVKKMLEELFQPAAADEEMHAADYDYMLAFTRTGDMLQFHVFKFHTQPTPDMKSMSLEEVSPSFILKPLEIHRPGDSRKDTVSEVCVDEDGLMSHTGEDPLIEVFMDEDGLMPERTSEVELVSYSVFYDDSYQPMVPHIMQSAVSHKVMLPSPVKNLRWFGFNTSGQEFFERYYSYRTTHVPGTGPDPTLTAGTSNPSASAISSTFPDPTSTVTVETSDHMASADTAVYYDHISVPMKVFCRGLIRCVKANHRYGCLSDFNEKNIFLRRGRVVILGVKLLAYSKEEAVKNFRTVYKIIVHILKGMTISPDLVAVLDLLWEKPIEKYTIIENHFAWMLAQRRDNMVAELHENFSELLPDKQASLTKTLPDMNKWLSKFASNRLLFDVQTDRLPSKSTVSIEALEKLFEKKAANMQNDAAKTNNLMDLLKDPGNELQLFIGRRYVKGIRNSYVHLSSTSMKKKLGPLPIEIVDVVVSSQFAATCGYIQEKIPHAFSGIDEDRACYERFKTFFCCPEDIKFKADDEKPLNSDPLRSG